MDTQISPLSSSDSPTTIQQFSEKFAHLFFEHGFMDGGCAALAIALRSVLKDSQLYGCFQKNVLHHVVVKYKGYYIDADGVSCVNRLKDKMQSQELCSIDDVSPIFYTQIEDSGIRTYTENGTPQHIALMLRQFGILENIDFTIAVLANTSFQAVPINTSRGLVNVH
jgi:hypothetical protein